MASTGAVRGSGSRVSRVFSSHSSRLQTGLLSRSSTAAAAGIGASSLLGSVGLGPTALYGSVFCHVASSQELFFLRSCASPRLASDGWLHSRVVGVEAPFAVRGLVTAGGGPQEQQVAAGAPSSGPASGKAGDEVEARREETGKEVQESEYWWITPKKFQREDGSEWPWRSFRPSDSYAADVNIDLAKHFKPQNWGDTFAYYLVKSMRVPVDLFFQKRYGCRAMMLETVAAVPGMVAGMAMHLSSLRRFEHTGGWIRALLEEAENERMHLMTFMEVSQPRWYERALVLAVQGVFFNVYSIVYFINPKLAHRVVGYLEEEAIHSYTEFLKEIDAGRIENVPAPLIAIDYWRLPKDATLRDVVVSVRADEAHHRDVNHFASNVLKSGKRLNENPAPVDYH